MGMKREFKNGKFVEKWYTVDSVSVEDAVGAVRRVMQDTDVLTKELQELPVFLFGRNDYCNHKMLAGALGRSVGRLRFLGIGMVKMRKQVVTGGEYLNVYCFYCIERVTNEEACLDAADFLEELLKERRAVVREAKKQQRAMEAALAKKPRAKRVTQPKLVNLVYCLECLFRHTAQAYNTGVIVGTLQDLYDYLVNTGLVEARVLGDFRRYFHDSFESFAVVVESPAFVERMRARGLDVTRLGEVYALYRYDYAFEVPALLQNLGLKVCTHCGGKGEYMYQAEDGSVVPVICGYCDGEGQRKE